jgi:hypothetical protein
MGGASSGTILIMFAESIPDTYWFKKCLIYAAPSLSVSFSAITDWGVRQSKLLYDYLTASIRLSRISKKIKGLKDDPFALQEDIRQLEAEFWAIKVKDAKRTMGTVKKEGVE